MPTPFTSTSLASSPPSQQLEQPQSVPQQHQPGSLTKNPRLSLPFSLRLPLSLALSSLFGASLGLSHGSRNAGLRFRAENAHRLPTTPTGWYLYHKSKNYHVALGGIKEGTRMGLRV